MLRNSNRTYGFRAVRGGSRHTNIVFAERTSLFERATTVTVHAAYDRLAGIRPPDRHHLPAGGRSLEQLRVLDTWVRSRRI